MKGHILKLLKALGGRYFGTVCGPRAGGERQFPGGDVEEARARVEAWLRKGRRRVESRFWGCEDGMFIVPRKGRCLFDENVCVGDKEKVIDNDYRFSSLSDINA